GHRAFLAGQGRARHQDLRRAVPKGLAGPDRRLSGPGAGPGGQAARWQADAAAGARVEQVCRRRRRGGRGDQCRGREKADRGGGERWASWHGSLTATRRSQLTSRGRSRGPWTWTLGRIWRRTTGTG